MSTPTSPDIAPLLAALSRVERLASRPEAAGALQPLVEEALKACADLCGRGRHHDVLALTSRLKALRLAPENLDLLRAAAFLGLGQAPSAREALKEELRLHPGNAQARELLARLPGGPALAAQDPELAAILPVIAPYTMVGAERLATLFAGARRVCQEDLPGDFAECGVAAGGTSALLAWVIKRYSKRPRLLHCFDTFSGMPAPTDKDTHAGTHAQDTGWGAGTCAAPMDSLREVCAKLGAADVIRPVAGLFKDTLPAAAASIPGLAMLHMDGDWYDSTRDILVNLYDRVVPGGFIQVDDYGFWDGCDQAIAHYFAEHGIAAELTRVAGGTGAWFRKPIARTEKSGRLLVNLGCGGRHHPDWVNIDKNVDHPDVTRRDILSGLPLADNSADAVYHSHVLEHLPKALAPAFLAECRRVLKPGGILRVAVPDLENIARAYLASLEQALSDDADAQARHEWMTIELVDQIARHAPGGEMLTRLRENPLPAEAFVYERLGSEAREIVTALRESNRPAPQAPQEPDAEKLGRFRLSGECHLWMYDRVSLAGLLVRAGFTGARVVAADESAIPGFNDYLLDIEADGSVRKPDSLFMEAVKPLSGEAA